MASPVLRMRPPAACLPRLCMSHYDNANRKAIHHRPLTLRSFCGRDVIPFPHLQSSKGCCFLVEEEFVHARANEVNGILLLLCFDIWLPFGQVRVSLSLVAALSSSFLFSRSLHLAKMVPGRKYPDRFRKIPSRPSVRYGSSCLPLARSHTSVMLSRAFHCRVGGRGCERERVHGRTGEFVL